MQESRNQLAAAQGAGAVQIAERGGDKWLQETEASRQATLLGMQFGATSGANQASALAQANQMNAQMAQNQAWADGISGVGTAAAGADWGDGAKVKDPRLKGVDDGTFEGELRKFGNSTNEGFATYEWKGGKWIKE